MGSARQGGIAAKGIEAPGILAKLVAEHVKVVVIGAHLEALVIRPVPAVEDFCYLVSVSGWGTRALRSGIRLTGRRNKTETHRPFVGLVTRIAFDLEERRHIFSKGSLRGRSGCGPGFAARVNDRARHTSGCGPQRRSACRSSSGASRACLSGW